jgi:hypothetical protein
VVRAVDGSAIRLSTQSTQEKEDLMYGDVSVGGESGDGTAAPKAASERVARMVVAFMVCDWVLREDGYYRT